jgi:hypothetical protein
MAELRAIQRDAPWECSNYDAATRTCEGLARTTWRDDGTGTPEVAVLAAETPRVALVVSGPVWAEGDMECGRFADFPVRVAASDPLPPGAAARIEAAFKGALASRGTVGCTGLVRDGDGFRTVDYRDGNPTGPTSTLRFFADRPALRVPDRQA